MITKLNKLKCFCTDIPASKIALLIKLSMNKFCRYYSILINNDSYHRDKISLLKN